MNENDCIIPMWRNIKYLTPSLLTVPSVTPCASWTLDYDCRRLSLRYRSSYWSCYVVSLGAECHHDYQ